MTGVPMMREPRTRTLGVGARRASGRPEMQGQGRAALLEGGSAVSKGGETPSLGLPRQREGRRLVISTPPPKPPQ
eukprot:3195446-Pyramimonas_sp.AAC.1